MPSPPAPNPLRLPIPDAGWLFLSAGLALLAATVLIPASADLARTRHARDTSIALERLHDERYRRHAEYLDAVLAQDPLVMDQLAARQFNLVPEGARPLTGAVVPTSQPATVFSQFEPDPVAAPELRLTDSTLAQLASGDRSRLWLIAAGGVMVLIGLMPRVRSA
ncbi:MAG: hypothetical protein AAGG07_09200 [Planctomycetota bacterium]